MASQKPLIVVNGTNQQLPNGDTLVVGTGIDASAAGTLTIGGTTATSIVLGSATIPVEIPGDVTTVGGTTFTTDATFEGDVTFGNAVTDTVTFTAEVDSDIAFKAPGHKITNLANGTNPGDAVNFSQLSAIVSGVSAVTASAPLASSGGATPDISLTGIVPVANGGTGTSTAFTPGSVVFAGASGVYSQDNANLFFDDTNNRLGIGTPSPSTTLHVNSGAVNGTAIATLQNTAGDFQIFRVDANPEGSVTGSIGDIADDSTNGVVYVKTSGSATNTGWSPLANLGTKVYLVVEGGQYPTIQAAIDATPTGTNVVPAYSVILVGPKANTGGGASGTWGPAVLAANKSLMIAGLGGAQTSKDIRIDSLTFDSSAAGLNANLNENYISGLYIISSSASSIVTFSGTGAIRLKLNNCYVVNTGAGDAVVNTNSNVNGSLYLNNCIVSSQSATGIALRNSGNTYVQNRTEISTTGGGVAGDTGRAISTSGGNVFLFDSSVEATAPRPAVELTGGSAYLEATYSRIQNFNNTATATVVTAAAGTNFGAGFVSLVVGSSVAALGSNVAGAGTFTYSDVSFGFVPTLTVTTQNAAFATAPWFTTAVKQGVSLTAPGSGLFQLNTSGRLTRYNDAAPTNGQVLIGDTAAGYWKAATITAGSGVAITNGAGTISISATGSGGTVTSVDVSGGTTGLTTSGGPITGAGTITLGGTLGVANGGTGTATAFTPGSVVFAGTSGVYAQDNANLFWNDTNNRLGIGTATPTGTLHVVGGTAAAGVNGTAITLAAQNGGSGGTTSGGDVLLIGGATGGVNAGSVIARSDNPLGFRVQDTAGTRTTLSVNTGISNKVTTANLLVNPSSNTTALQVQNSTFFTVFNVDTTNNRVGVNTFTPTGTLQVVGGTAAASTAGTPITLTAQAGGTGNTNGGNVALNAGAAGGTGTAGSVVLTAGAGTAPGSVIARAGTNGTASFQVQTSTSTTVLDVDTLNQRVGIGTVTPASALSVGSTSQFQVSSTGDIVAIRGQTTTFPAANAAGVLTNNGSGTLSWSPAATGTITGSGTATQLAYFTGASAIGSEAASGSNALTWNSTNNLFGVRTASPSNVVDVQAGALNDGQSALSVTGTLSSTVATQRGVTMFITGAGSGAQQIQGVIAGISGGGYTGTGSSIGANFYNESLGTGDEPFAQVSGNIAVRGQAYGASAAGHNVGFYATAQNALRNFGFLSVQNASSQANGYNVGVATSTHNAAASGVRVGGFFSIDTTFLPAEPTLTSAALIADNTSTTDPIFLARDSGATTFSIGNNGVVLAKNTADSTTAFSVQDSSGNTLLGIDTVNDRVGVGGVAGASLTHTFNVGSAGSAAFCVASGGRIHTYDGTAPTNGQVLIGDTALGNFAKATLTAGTGIAITNGAGTISIAASNAGGVQPITTISTTTTLDGTNYTVLCSATLTVNLPAAASNTGRVYNIKNIGAAATITIDGNAAETIDGAATYTLATQYQSVTIQSDGSNWFIL